MEVQKALKSDLKELPKLRDSISYVYMEHARIDQDALAIMFEVGDGRIPVPVASLTCLMLGPGTTITHAAVKTIAENGCLIVWCGENASRFYASGMGETRSARNTLLQAELCMDREKHLAVVRKMYEIRFPKMPTKGLTLEQIRGMEGIRVRQAYQMFSKQYGVKWGKRDYKQKEWDNTDPINQALSEANAILYSLCQAAIVSLGYSTALGFIHTGKALSFVYDIADLYKAETTIPAAFEAVGRGVGELSRNVRINCRKYFASVGVLKRIAKDIELIFSVGGTEEDDSKDVGDIWDEDGTTISGGINYGREVD